MNKVTKHRHMLIVCGLKKTSNGLFDGDSEEDLSRVFEILFDFDIAVGLDGLSDDLGRPLLLLSILLDGCITVTMISNQSFPRHFPKMGIFFILL